MLLVAWGLGAVAGELLDTLAHRRLGQEVVDHLGELVQGLTDGASGTALRDPEELLGGSRRRVCGPADQLASRGR